MLPGIAHPDLIIYPDHSAPFEGGQAAAIYRALPSAELAVNPKRGQKTYEQNTQNDLWPALGLPGSPGAGTRARSWS